MRPSLSALMLWMTIPFISYIAHSQSSCSEFTDEATCNFNSHGACLWSISALTGSYGQCQCKSDVKLDILFALDASGSIDSGIELNGFHILKQFINDLVIQDINTHDSKIGFTIFSTRVNFSRSIRMWNTTELQHYISGIHWSGGWRNTPQLIQESILEFQGLRNGSTYTPYVDRQQVLIMITDGDPCIPDTTCPLSLCQYKSSITALGVRVIIIAIGDALTPEYVQCLCQTQTDFIPIDSYSTVDFYSIVGSLSAVLCPVAIESDDDLTLLPTFKPAEPIKSPTEPIVYSTEEPTNEQSIVSSTKPTIMASQQVDEIMYTTNHAHDVTIEEDDDRSHSDRDLIYGGVGIFCLLTLCVTYRYLHSDAVHRNKNEENRKAMEVVTKGNNDEEQLITEISDHEGSRSEGITKNVAISLEHSKSHDLRMNPRAEGSEHSGNSESMFVVEESENEKSRDHNNYNGPIFFETTKKVSADII